MKKVYWRPKAVSRTALTLIACFSLMGLLLVELVPVRTRQPWQEEKRQAAELAVEAFDSIFWARQQTKEVMDLEADPTGSGLIGLSMSSVTSLVGTLEDKQSSINPNFAAVIVQLLKEAGVEKGDVVAIGVSGSFPALNICALAALETLETEPILISSAASSSWGANIPELLWLDMERILVEEDNIFTTRSVAASIGGYADRGLRFPDEGIAAIEKAIERNGLELIKVKKFEEIVDRRMEIYEQHAGDKPIKAYINVGGGMVSVGRTEGKKALDSGLNTNLPSEARELDGVMIRFAKQGIPVIHIINVERLAEKYGMPVSPVTMPSVGDAAVFERWEFNKWLAAAILIAELAMLYAFIRSDLGSRIFRRSGKSKETAAPEPMI